jgi:hypothetical protein
MSNSFTSCISNAPKEFSWAPEMSLLENFPQPRMFLQKFEGRITLEQLQSFANTHCSWHLNKQMDMVNSDVQIINFESVPVSHLSNEKLTIHSDSIELHRVMGIFTFPDKMESILSEGMFKTFQIHFLSPQNIAHAKSVNLVPRATTSSRDNQEFKFYKEDGNSSLCLKAEVSLPLM